MHELFESWVRDHHAAVYRSAWAIVRDADDAAEVTQEVFLQALRRIVELARAESPERVLRWLSVKGALARLRGEKHRRQREQELAMRRPELSEEEPPERRELKSAVRECVAALPDELRLATVLRFQEGLTFAELGECLGVAEPTAFERVKRALEKLRAKLTQLGHAGALAGLEHLLAANAGLEEGLAVPAGLAPKLLALAGSGAGAAVAMSAGSKALLALAAAAVLVGGGIFATRALHEPAASDGARAVVAAADSAAPRDDAPAPTRAEEHGDGARSGAAARDPVHVRRASEFLGSDVPLPPGGELDREVDTGTITGVVVDDDGRVVPDARIEAVSLDGASKAFQWRGNSRSDLEGRFAMEVAVVVEGGQRYSLTFRHEDCLVHRTAPARVVAHATTDLQTVRLRRNMADRAGDYELAIVVQDADGRPVPGAFARLYRVLETREDSAPTADDAAPTAEDEQPAMEDGPWEVGGVADETGTVHVAGTRIGRKTLVIDATKLGYRMLRRPIEIGWTGFQEQRFKLEKGLAIAGRLVFPAGVDVATESLGGDVSAEGVAQGGFPGAQVYAIGADPNEWTHAELSADGSFRIVGLQPGRYSVHVSSGFSPAALFDVEAGREDLVIALKRCDDVSDSGAHLGEIHGRFVDAATGAPVSAPWDAIEVEAVDAKADEATLRDDLLPTMTPPRMGQVSMDPYFRPPPPSAEFHTTGLPEGRYVAIARVAGYAAGFSRPIALASHGFAKDVVIELHRPAQLSGLVVDDSGRPLARAYVFVVGSGAASKALVAAVDESVRQNGIDQECWIVETVRTDAEGRFTLGNLPPQLAVAVGVVHPAFAPATSEPFRLVAGATHDAGRLPLRPHR